MRYQSPSPDRRKVADLKDKAREERNRAAPSSNRTINDVWYGPQTENPRAAGGGEYDT